MVVGELGDVPGSAGPVGAPEPAGVDIVGPVLAGEFVACLSDSLEVEQAPARAATAIAAAATLTPGALKCTPSRGNSQ